MKRAFTLIELAFVIAVIAILMTIVTTAASSAMRASREKKRDAMALVLREGLATYYARNGKWPGGIESKADNGQNHTFSGSEADSVFRVIVKESVGRKNPYLDPHALFVAPSGVSENRDVGIPFADARAKEPPPHRRRLGVDSMAFGFQDPSSGRFRRYAIRYISASDSVRVGWLERNGNFAAP